MPWDAIDNFGDVVEMEIPKGNSRPTPSGSKSVHPKRVQVSKPNFKKFREGSKSPDSLDKEAVKWMISGSTAAIERVISEEDEYSIGR